MALDVNLSVALGALALWLLAHGLENVGFFQRYPGAKMGMGIALILDFLLVIGVLLRANGVI